MGKITKQGFPGGAEYGFNGFILLMISIVANGMFVSLVVEKFRGVLNG